MDFRRTDALADPPGAEQFHSEQLVRMPHGFLCFNPPSEAPPPLHPPILTTAGAPTFGCFNNYAKITPEMLAVWAQILHRLPEARLMIKNKGLQCTGLQERLHHQFHQLGVKAERIILVPQVKSYTEHLDLYNQVDVALDTSPYNGTTTTCEALWMGVPVVTLRGDRHSARVGASILSRVGLDRLVAETTDRYVSIAVDLAIQTDVLGQYRKSLRETMRSIPLGNPPMFARTFEKTLLQLSQAQSV